MDTQKNNFPAQKNINGCAEKNKWLRREKLGQPHQIFT